MRRTVNRTNESILISESTTSNIVNYVTMKIHGVEEEQILQLVICSRGYTPRRGPFADFTWVPFTGSRLEGFITLFATRTILDHHDSSRD